MLDTTDTLIGPNRGQNAVQHYNLTRRLSLEREPRINRLISHYPSLNNSMHINHQQVQWHPAIQCIRRFE